MLDEISVSELIANISGSLGDTYKDISCVHVGARFVLAEALHIGTDRSVLLTIAPPGEVDAMHQLGVMRMLFDAVADARIGSTYDRIWERNKEKRGWACLVSSFHSGAVGVDKALVATSDELPPIDPWAVLTAIAEQVRAIHRADFAHGDLSTSNIIVDRLGMTHIIDLEHCVALSSETISSIAYTDGFSHPGKRTVGSIKDVNLQTHQRWDLYALGKIFLDVLSITTPSKYPLFTVRLQRAIRTVGCLLLDGKNSRSETAMGLPQEFFSQNRIESAEQLCQILDGLGGRIRYDEWIPELKSGVDKVIEVGSVRPAPSTRRVNSVIASTEFRYLNSFNQLGLISYIWPKATHHRYVHSIGTFTLCCQAVESLLSDAQNPLFAILMSPTYVRVLLCAALLHDLGHYPLAHDVEEALPSMLDHENRSIEILSTSDWIKRLAVSEQEGGWQINSIDVASVINGSPLPGASLSSSLCTLLHTIISGSLDVDKLDYLIRDSLMLDVKAGEGIDRQRIFAGLTVAVVKVNGTAPQLTIAIAEKSRRPAELVGRVRSHLFGVAYWHHSYRSIKCMIQWMVWSAVVKLTASAGVGKSTQIHDIAKAVETIPLLNNTKMQTSIKRLCVEFLDMVRVESTNFTPNLSLLDASTRSVNNIPFGEGRVLQWWAARGDETGRDMLQSLDREEPFRTILELSHPERVSVSSVTSEASAPETSSLSAAIWSAFDNIPSNIKINEYIKFRYILATCIQLEITGWLLQRREGNAKTIVYGFLDERDQLISAAASHQLFLVDYPDESKSYQKPLYVAASENRHRTSTDAAAGIEVTRSYDSVRVGEEFVISNGSVRVFCHSKFSAFVSQSISSVTLTELLKQATDTAIEKCGLEASVKKKE